MKGITSNLEGSALQNNNDQHKKNTPTIWEKICAYYSSIKGSYNKAFVKLSKY